MVNETPKRTIHNSLCKIYGSATSIAAQIILSDLQDAGHVHREPLEARPVTHPSPGAQADAPSEAESRFQDMFDRVLHLSEVLNDIAEMDPDLADDTGEYANRIHKIAADACDGYGVFKPEVPPPNTTKGEG